MTEQTVGQGRPFATEYQEKSHEQDGPQHSNSTFYTKQNSSMFCYGSEQKIP